jgi:hypothetical protein
VAAVPSGLSLTPLTIIKKIIAGRITIAMNITERRQKVVYLIHVTHNE